jgi:hypothetical protein
VPDVCQYEPDAFLRSSALRVAPSRGKPEPRQRKISTLAAAFPGAR